MIQQITAWQQAGRVNAQLLRNRYHEKNCPAISVMNFAMQLFCSVNILFGQTTESESIDWAHLKTFSAKGFEFKSDKISFKCGECRYIEISSNSGVSGYFVLADASFTIKDEKIEDMSTATMIRLNPYHEKLRYR